MWPCVTIAHHSEQSYQSTPSHACIYQPTRFRYSLGQQYRPPIRAELPIFPTFTSQYDYVILSGSNTTQQSDQTSQSVHPLPANKIVYYLGQQYRPPIRAELSVSSWSCLHLPTNNIPLLSWEAIPPTNQSRAISIFPT